MFTPYDASFYGVCWGHIFADFGAWGPSRLFSVCESSEGVKLPREGRSSQLLLERPGRSLGTSGNPLNCS